MSDIRLLPRRIYLHSCAILRSVEWQYSTDVSGQPIGPNFKDHQSEKNAFLYLENELIDCVETAARNYHSTLRIIRAVQIYMKRLTIRFMTLFFSNLYLVPCLYKNL